MRELKFRAVVIDDDGYTGLKYNVWPVGDKVFVEHGGFWMRYEMIHQFIGLNDKNGKEIYEGDILEFSDKWEWYKCKYGIRIAEHKRRQELQKEYEAEPMERRVITMPECYEWIISTEIQTYWQVVGNIHENTDLIQ